MRLMQIVILVLLSVCMSLSVAEGSGDLTVSGTTITSDLTLTQDVDCTGHPGDAITIGSTNSSLTPSP